MKKSGLYFILVLITTLTTLGISSCTFSDHYPDTHTAEHPKDYSQTPARIVIPMQYSSVIGHRVRQWAEQRTDDSDISILIQVLLKNPVTQSKMFEAQQELRKFIRKFGIDKIEQENFSTDENNADLVIAFGLVVKIRKPQQLIDIANAISESEEYTTLSPKYSYPSLSVPYMFDSSIELSVTDIGALGLHKITDPYFLADMTINAEDRVFTVFMRAQTPDEVREKFSHFQNVHLITKEIWWENIITDQYKPLDDEHPYEGKAATFMRVVVYGNDLGLKEALKHPDVIWAGHYTSEYFDHYIEKAYSMLTPRLLERMLNPKFEPYKVRITRRVLGEGRTIKLVPVFAYATWEEGIEPIIKALHYAEDVDLAEEGQD